MKNLIGKKVRGFKFESMKYNDLHYGTEMDNHIGEIGTIKDSDKEVASVQFKSDWWRYPASLIEQHLVEEDVVNEPSHYKLPNGIEVIDVIEGAELGFHLANSVKYILRAGKKDKDKELQDLKKAEYYLKRKIKQLES